MQLSVKDSRVVVGHKPNIPVEDDVAVQSLQQRRSYPVEDSQSQTLKRKRSLTELENDSSKRRKSHPAYVHQAHLSHRLQTSYDTPTGHISKRRVSCRLDYYPAHGSRCRYSVDGGSPNESHAIYFCTKCPRTFTTKGKLDLHFGRTHRSASQSSGTKPTNTIIERNKQSVITNYQVQSPKRQPSVIVIDPGSPFRKTKRKPSVIVITDDTSAVQIMRRRSSHGTSSQPENSTRKRSIIYINDDDSPAPKGRNSSRLKKARAKLLKNEQPQRVLKESFPCPHCEEVFEATGMKQEHLAQSHPEEFSKLTARCEKCSFRFRSILDLDKHAKAVHTAKGLPGNNDASDGPVKVTCFVCSTEVAKSGLRQHIKNKHPRAWDQRFKLDKMEKRYCPVCSRLIDDEQRNLKGHIRKDHPDLWNRELTEQEMLAPEKKQGTQWADCEVCHKRYHADRLGRHMELMHSPAQEVTQCL